MNDGNIKYYLEQEMSDLKSKILARETFIDGYHKRVDDALKELKNLRIHYTSLLNTAIAYGHEVEDDEQDDQT